MYCKLHIIETEGERKYSKYTNWSGKMWEIMKRYPYPFDRWHGWVSAQGRRCAQERCTIRKSTWASKIESRLASDEASSQSASSSLRALHSDKDVKAQKKAHKKKDSIYTRVKTIQHFVFEVSGVGSSVFVIFCFSLFFSFLDQPSLCDYVQHASYNL